MSTSISKFSTKGKESHSIASKLEGNLFISRSTFPYFILVAFEAGGPVRALILLIVSPILLLLEWFCHDKLALHLMIFISLAGLKAVDVNAISKSVLPRFFLDDTRASAFKVFSSCGGKKCVVTSMPRIMVEAFLRHYLNVDCVIGTELRFFGGYCLGLVAKPEEVMGCSQSKIIITTLDGAKKFDIGLGGEFDENPLMPSCQERYVVPDDDEASPLPRDDYPKPLIFHDGRLVARPTPLNSLAICLWLPMGILLAVIRIPIGILLPYKLHPMAIAATGLKTRVKLPLNHACPPQVPYRRCRCESCDSGPYGRDTNTLYVCSHRTLMDPVMLSVVLQRPVTAVTYSISRISEILSPIRTVELSRDRAKDAETMQEILKKGDLVVCPEGTTCREPYLLRFSPLFAEIADVIVPVAVEAKSTMFYGTTVRGYKCLDSFFFLMNPNPEYQIQFLEKLSGDSTRDKSSYEVANSVQKLIGNALGFECTNLTRKDKYRMLAGNDGSVTRR